jgi:hypothetical protein
MNMKALFHIHTRYSPDALLSPAKALKYAQDNGFDVLAVTDHDTLAGAREAEKLNKSSRLSIITGAEYSTEKGHIIGLFLKDDIWPGNSVDVISAIKSQGGLVVLPHPVRLKVMDDELMRHVDIVEGHNCRVDSAGNRFAMELARAYDKPVLLGNDAHFAGELKLGAVEFHNRYDDPRKTILKAQRTLHVKSSSHYYKQISGFIHSYRQYGLYIAFMREFMEKIAKFLPKPTGSGK